MRREIDNLQRMLGVTTIFVTHDQREALSMSDKILVMKDGKKQQEGGPETVYNEPANHFVADFLGHSNFIAGQVVDVKRKAREAPGRNRGHSLSQKQRGIFQRGLGGADRSGAAVRRLSQGRGRGGVAGNELFPWAHPGQKLYGGRSQLFHPAGGASAKSMPSA